MATSEQDRQHLRETHQHIQEVRRYMRAIAEELLVRSRKHDESKLEEPERSIFAEVAGELSGLTYGSDEYHKQLEKLDEALEHHYEANSHHPEHYEKGIDGMDLPDLVEMFCDWMAAVERHDDGDIWDSIEHNQERFDMSPQLVAIFKNTVKRL